MPLFLDYKRADRVPTVHIQKALTDQGFTPGPADGRFGLATLKAVVAYQEKYGLDPTGAVDEGLYASIISTDTPAPKKAPAKKAPAKKPAATAPDEKPPAKKPAAKKAPAKKATTKKPSVTT